MATAKISLEQLEKDGVKILTKEDLSKVSPGDWIDCDTLHQSLLHAGYDVSYENVDSDMAGFLAVFYLNGEKICSVEGSDTGHMVKRWTDLDSLDELAKAEKKIEGHFHPEDKNLDKYQIDLSNPYHGSGSDSQESFEIYECPKCNGHFLVECTALESIDHFNCPYCMCKFVGDKEKTKKENNCEVI